MNPPPDRMLKLGGYPRGSPGGIPQGTPPGSPQGDTRGVLLGGIPQKPPQMSPRSFQIACSLPKRATSLVSAQGGTASLRSPQGGTASLLSQLAAPAAQLVCSGGLGVLPQQCSVRATD